MKYKLIVAISKNRGIGKDGSLPWSIKEDLSFFSRTTKGNGNNAIVMGRKTWDSLNGRHLPKRNNLILSSTLQKDEVVSGFNVKSFKSIDDIEKHVQEHNYDDVWIIGGSEVYKRYLETDKVNTCLITYIDHDFDCDTYFPELKPNWSLVETTPLHTSETFTIKVQRFVSEESTFVT